MYGIFIILSKYSAVSVLNGRAVNSSSVQHVDSGNTQTTAWTDCPESRTCSKTTTRGRMVTPWEVVLFTLWGW